MARTGVPPSGEEVLRFVRQLIRGQIPLDAFAPGSQLYRLLFRPNVER
jgi:hypothetical protein